MPENAGNNRKPPRRKTPENAGNARRKTPENAGHRRQVLRDLRLHSRTLCRILTLAERRQWEQQCLSTFLHPMPEGGTAATDEPPAKRRRTGHGSTVTRLVRKAAADYLQALDHVLSVAGKEYWAKATAADPLFNHFYEALCADLGQGPRFGRDLRIRFRGVWRHGGPRQGPRAM